MNYEIGDKFIIEIDRIYSSKKHSESRYGIKGFENFVLSKRKLDELLKHKNIERLEEHDIAVSERAFQQGFDQKSEWFQNDAYKHGLEDAWELARKLFSMCHAEICKCFYSGDDQGMSANEMARTVLKSHSPQEAIDKLKYYDEQKAKNAEIHLGNGYLKRKDVLENVLSQMTISGSMNAMSERIKNLQEVDVVERKHEHLNQGHGDAEKLYRMSV